MSRLSTRNMKKEVSKLSGLETVRFTDGRVAVVVKSSRSPRVRKCTNRKTSDSLTSTYRSDYYAKNTKKHRKLNLKKEPRLRTRYDTTIQQCFGQDSLFSWQSTLKRKN
ncbi:hypothetical protein PCE1_002678 [Barthelona sp. PCE]